jgi:predicted nucleic acid-binding protein
VRLFLDTSVLLAASGSSRGASRFLVVEAVAHGWVLVSSDYCEEETRRNLLKVGRGAGIAWRRNIRPSVRFVRASLSLDKPLVFPKAKDRPVVITALATRSDWLLTLDAGDFHTKLGQEVYGLRIATPGEFLVEQRAQGVL